VVARGGGHHPAAFPPLFKEGQAVKRPSQLEGAGGLEIFQFQEDFPATGPAQGMGVDEGGAEDYSLLPFSGCFNILNSHGFMIRVIPLKTTPGLMRKSI